MDGYDTMPAMMSPYLPTTIPGTSDPMALPLVSLENLDPTSFDADAYAGYDLFRYHTTSPVGSSENTDRYSRSEDASQYMQPPSIKRYSAGYDDGYSDVLSNFETAFPAEQTTVESPSIDRDHKLLSFSPPSLPYTLLDYALRPVFVSMTAQLHGMFFLAESSIPTSAEASPPLTELTCYRRNLFQVTGNLTIPRNLGYIVMERGEQIPIMGYELAISANETIEGNSVKIICVPWKTSATSAPIEDKSEKEPTSMPIDLSQADDMEAEFAIVPIAWKRLQFRIATANNGRRKELQQHFLVHLKVIATLSTGARVSICEIQSGAIIVRGRSPRNFQSRKDMPISGSGAFGRRSHHVRGHSTGDTSLSAHSQPKTEHPDQQLGGFGLSQLPFSFDSQALGVSGDMIDWKVPTGQVGAMTAIPPVISITDIGGVNAYAHSSPDLSRAFPRNRRQSKAPISLSLVDDDLKTSHINEPPMPASASTTGKSRAGAPSPSFKRSRTEQTQPTAAPVRPPSFSITPLSMADESADMLYEYFPLGLDDWMPPVDAVYRPHVVHQTNLPADPKAIKNRGKRYFSEDQS
jgi:NDT80/PhoG-like DNA-binding protein